jgi:hypothetical protein
LSRGRPWTGDDTETLRRHAAAGDDDAMIGRKMHRDRTLIVRKRAEHQIDRGQSAGLTAVMARFNLRRLIAGGDDEPPGRFDYLAKERRREPVWQHSDHDQRANAGI